MWWCCLVALENDDNSHRITCACVDHHQKRRLQKNARKNRGTVCRLRKQSKRQHRQHLKPSQTRRVAGVYDVLLLLYTISLTCSHISQVMCGHGFHRFSTFSCFHYVYFAFFQVNQSYTAQQALAQQLQQKYKHHSKAVREQR